MVLGRTRREMEEYTRVPATVLRRHYIALVGKPPNKRIPLTLVEQHQAMQSLNDFVPTGKGDSSKYFTRDEEEMFVITIEESHAAAFPYDTDTVERMATQAGKAVYGEKFIAGRKWRLGFEARWKHRLSKVKCSSIDRCRGQKATAEVRDAVFEKFNKFVEKLVEDHKMTPAQVDNLGEHLANCDEVGGDERGKGTKKVYCGVNAAHGSWRTTDYAGDHEPFHVTVMLTTMAIGILLNAIMLIHSCPGVMNPRMASHLYEHVPDEWSVKRTSSGSMTKMTFEDWAKYFTRSMEQSGYGKKHGPIILLIDGHSSRWTYDGLNTLIEAGIYPFFIGSHTSAWHQPNGLRPRSPRCCRLPRCQILF